MQVEVSTPTNTMNEKHILLPQPMHNSGTMNVPLHADSMTDSSESSNMTRCYLTSWSPMMTAITQSFVSSLCL